MYRPAFLIIGTSSALAVYAAWIAEAGYNLITLPDWPAEAHLLNQYDLILLDEHLWLADPPLLRETIQAGGHIVVLSSDYSKEGYKRIMQAGAKGYVGANFGRDIFVQEVEKILRRIGKLPKRGRVLVVDNDPHVLGALKNTLEKERYEVFTAAKAEDALQSIQVNQPHVAVVDIRLRDDDDPLDQSGFDLVQEIVARYGHALRVVGLTGSPVRQTATRAAGLLSGFVLKESRMRVDDLKPKIEVALEELGINTSLDLSFEEPLSLAGLVNMMKAYRHLDQRQRDKVTVELEELIRKLFHHESAVKGYYLSPGRGGSGVVLMRPIVEGTKGQYFVVKFGPRENLSVELNNYNLYVKPFVGKRATHLVDIVSKPAETLNLGGLKFSFVGMSVDKPQDFNSYYRDPTVTVEQICASLRYLFNRACAHWYQARRNCPDRSPDALTKAYETHLSLALPDKRQELTAAFEHLLHGQTLHGISFRAHSSNDIKICLADQTLIFLNPLQFVKQYRDALPVPNFECRTHGDLNGRNIFVDEDASVWLIDFFKTGWGPILRDFGELETVIKFELLDTYNLPMLYEFEKALLNPRTFDEPAEFAGRQTAPGFNRAWVAINELRRLAREKSGSADMKEYYAGLLFFALRMLTWEGISSVERERYPIRQRHALLSAAMLSQRLAGWDRWEGWP